jgi:hypothetical protein
MVRWGIDPRESECFATVPATLERNKWLITETARPEAGGAALTRQLEIAICYTKRLTDEILKRTEEMLTHAGERGKGAEESQDTPAARRNAENGSHLSERL